MTIEGLNENNELCNIPEDLKNLKENIINENKEIDFEYIKSDDSLLKAIDRLKIPNDIVNKFIQKYKDFYEGKEIPKIDDNNLDNIFIKHLFGDLQLDEVNYFNSALISNTILLKFFYIKEISGENYNKTFKMVSEFFFNFYSHEIDFSLGISTVDNDEEVRYKLINMIKEYGDNVCDYFSFCSKKVGNYKKNSELTDDEKDSKFFEDSSTSMNFWEIFIEEPESVNLYNFLKEYPQILDNIGGKIINTIDLNIKNGVNFCFRGILEMVKSRPDIEFPYLNENPSDDDKQLWKETWEKIIKEYERTIRNYISEDFIKNSNGDKIEKPKEMTYNKIFYSQPNGDFIIDEHPLDKENIGQYSPSDISDYSYTKSDEDYNENNKSLDSKNKKMLNDIKGYVEQHPNEKILVCVVEHGEQNGSSKNGWSKENWLELANLSPNLKIWSIRCFFGAAFENEEIYNNKSSVSGFSNHIPTLGNISYYINEACGLGLGFHEMEIYTRLNYPVSVAPLTESMEYTNRNTGETEIGKIGLAQNDNQDIPNINYA